MMERDRETAKQFDTADKTVRITVQQHALTQQHF